MDMRRLRNLALIGALGAVIMLVGDFLYFLTPFTSGAEYHSQSAMRHMSPERLAWGATAGPIAGLFYSIGCCLFYLALRPHNKALAALVSAGFIFMWTLAGAFHALYAVVGVVGEGDPANIVPIVRGQFIGGMAKAAGLTALMASLLFAYMVLRYKTVFPKWIIVLIPVFWTLLQEPLRPFIPNPLGSIVIGGWPNWCFLAFFLLLARLWRRKAS